MTITETKPKEDSHIQVLADVYSLLFRTLMERLLDISGGNMMLAHSLALMAAERCKSDAHLSYADKLQQIKQEGTHD